MEKKKLIRALNKKQSLKLNKDEEIYNQFYDTKDDFINFHLKYDTYDDVFEKEENALKAHFTKAVNEDIEAIINTSLKLVNIKIHFEIKDKMNHSNDEIFDLIQDNYILCAVKIKHEMKAIRYRSIALMILGAIILMLSYALTKVNSIEIINDICNILGTLLIWEAGYALIVERSSDGRIQMKYSLLHMVTVVDEVNDAQ